MVHHDAKVVNYLIDTLDLKDTEILCTDKGYDLELLREKIKIRKPKLVFQKM